jgi:hypothetical protein
LLGSTLTAWVTLPALFWDIICLDWLQPPSSWSLPPE